jgi:hypothetical protein
VSPCHVAFHAAPPRVSYPTTHPANSPRTAAKRPSATAIGPLAVDGSCLANSGVASAPIPIAKPAGSIGPIIRHQSTSPANVAKPANAPTATTAPLPGSTPMPAIPPLIPSNFTRHRTDPSTLTFVTAGTRATAEVKPSRNGPTTVPPHTTSPSGCSAATLHEPGGSAPRAPSQEASRREASSPRSTHDPRPSTLSKVPSARAASTAPSHGPEDGQSSRTSRPSGPSSTR